MAKINSLTIALFAVAVFLAVAVAFMYVNYSYKSGLLVQQDANRLAQSLFVGEYSIPNITSVNAFYGSQVNNSIVFGCNYVIVPAFPQLPSQYFGTPSGSEYASIVKDTGLLSMCEVANISICARARDNLSVLISTLNASDIEEMYNQTAFEVYSLYSELLASNLSSLPSAAPVVYDARLVNSTKFGNETNMIGTILSLKELGQNTMLFGNGSVVSNDVSFYGPFTFRTFHLLNATACDSPAHIFNIVTNESAFLNPVYASLYSGLGADVTNICSVTATNTCNSSEMEAINASFYVG